MTRPALVKLGGSTLTDKDNLKTLREDALARLADELATVTSPLVLVHGAGSYGHVRSSRWDLARGDETATRDQAARVHADVAELHARVVDALAEAGLDPLGIPPQAVAHADDGALAALETDPFRRALEAGFTPVTRGDVLVDDALTFTPVSGDDILAGLADPPTRPGSDPPEPLRARIAVFATDVPGILDDDGEVIPRVGPEAARKLGTAADTPDVTGGMAGKARRAAALAEAGVPVRIVDGTTPGRIRGALEGDPVTGTLVTQGGST